MQLLARTGIVLSSLPAFRAFPVAPTSFSTIPSSFQRFPKPQAARLRSSARVLPRFQSQTTRDNMTEPPPSSTITLRTTSAYIRDTLDPCVVLMKAMMSRYAHLWEDRGGIVSLSQGVVHWTPPPSCYERVRSAMEGVNEKDVSLHTYAPEVGIPELQEALRAKLRDENGLTDIDVCVTAGANQAYVNCVLTLLGEGDRGIVFAPYYFNHVMAMQMTRGPESVVVGPSVGGVPDIEWLAQTLERHSSIRMVTLVNPGNPTGVSLPTETINKIANLCGSHGVWLVLDNTYEQFDHVGANSPGSGPAFPCPDREHVVNIFSFSKGYSMAGFRVGYLTVSKSGKGPTMLKQMLKVQDTIPICVSRISQVAALGALKAGRQWVKDQVATLAIGREAMLSALEPLSETMGGSGAMYLMGKLPEGVDDCELADRLVQKYGVAVIPGSFCGFPGWIRVCYSNLPPNECISAAERLRNGINEIVSNGII